MCWSHWSFEREREREREMIDPKNRKTVNLNFKKVEKFEIGLITGTRFRKQIAKLLNDTIIVYGQRPKDLIIT